jgi:hypothetical protein
MSINPTHSATPCWVYLIKLSRRCKPIQPACNANTGNQSFLPVSPSRRANSTQILYFSNLFAICTFTPFADGTKLNKAGAELSSSLHRRLACLIRVQEAWAVSATNKPSTSACAPEPNNQPRAFNTAQNLHTSRCSNCTESRSLRIRVTLYQDLVAASKHFLDGGMGARKPFRRVLSSLGSLSIPSFSLQSIIPLLCMTL